MSQYTYIVHASTIDSFEALNDIIENGDEYWPGLNSAEAIINIQIIDSMIFVYWRERKWLNSDAAAAEHQ